MAVTARARRYAEAIAQMAAAGNSWEQWAQDLAALAALTEQAGVRPILESPRVALARKEELLHQQLPDASPLARNLARLLVLKRRVEIISQIRDEFRRMYDEHRGIEHARVITAVPLEAQQRETLQGQLARYTGKQVEVATEVDPGILGGLVVRIGDKLIDGSTRGRLEALRKRLAG